MSDANSDVSDNSQSSMGFSPSAIVISPETRAKAHATGTFVGNVNTEKSRFASREIPLDNDHLQDNSQDNGTRFRQALEYG